MENAVQIVSQVGFPIAAFVMLFFFLKNELNEMRKTVDQNTLAITRLLTYMETKEGGEIDGAGRASVPRSQ